MIHRFLPPKPGYSASSLFPACKWKSPRSFCKRLVIDSSRFIMIVVIGLFSFLLSSLNASGKLLDSLKLHGHSSLPKMQYAPTTERGFLMCAGNHMIGEVIQMIWQLRFHWRSQLGISVAHCGEISAENHEFIKYLDPNVIMLNICDRNPTFGMPIEHARKRLRGFYCKVGAMIRSPFTETMLLDLDVVWFKSPDLLFSSAIYKNSTALYFRDRVYPSDNNRKNDYNLLQAKFVEKGIGSDFSSATALATANGISLYWKHIASKLSNNGTLFPQISDIQDSSVVLIDRSKHVATLKVLEELLPSFDIGYGDKEIFWIAATIAKTNFTFEPYLAAQYADCYGIILHYDPNDAAGSLSSSQQQQQATPLYVNGEYMVENDLMHVGQFLSPHMTPSVLVTEDIVPSLKMNTWPGGFKREMEGCTCKSFGCVPVPANVTKYMLYAEWVTFSKRLDRTGTPTNNDRFECVAVLVEYAEALQGMFAAEVRPEDCFFLGCPHLPIEIDLALAWNKEVKKRRVCDPVYFAQEAPPGLKAAAAAARRPDSAYNTPPFADGTPVQCEVDRQLYWFKNGTLYPFANWNAFVSKGLDLDNVVRVPRWQFENFPRSDKFVN